MKHCTQFLTLLVVSLAAMQATGANWEVVTAGAKGDGETDCTAIFQSLLDDARKAGGGVVSVPAGRFRINGHLKVPANVTLQGIFRVPPTPTGGGPAKLTGSVLLAYEGRGSTNGEPFIRLAGNNAAVVGLIIAYPEWSQNDVPPIPYPPCVESTDTENVGVQECCLLNPYEGIKLVRAARHLVRNVTGYPIRRGLFVDECYDIGHIENVHYWPFGVNYQADDPYCKWINTNGVAFEFARTDWHYVHNTFCFGYGIGYRFSKSRHGSCNGNFLGLGADSCRRAVYVEQAQPPGLLISNGEFVGRWGSTDSVCVEIATEAEGKVSLVNCSFWGPIDRCVWMRSIAGQFTASACNFVDWDNTGSGSAAIQLDAGRALVQGSTFSRSKLHVSVSSNVLSAILTGNQAPEGFRVRNQAGRRAQVALNEEYSVAFPEEARSHYEIKVGQPGDSRFLENWYDPERVGGAWRWSRGKSRLLLPCATNRPSELEIELHVPPQSNGPDSGLYYKGKRLGSLPAAGPLKITLPAAGEELLELELQCKEWVPATSIPGSQDSRALGVQVFRILMKAAGSTNRVFDANRGEWR
jgi:hypothetical protein